LGRFLDRHASKEAQLDDTGLLRIDDRQPGKQFINGQKISAPFSNASIYSLESRSGATSEMGLCAQRTGSRIESY
jgi:hypothetical protein